MLNIASTRTLLGTTLKRNIYQNTCRNFATNNSGIYCTKTNDSSVKDGARMNEQLFKRFPWGMMPVNSVGNSVWRKFCMFHAKWSANQLTRVDAKILFTDIVDGGAAAFRCSINGIFRHILMIKHEHGADAVCEDFIDHSGETEMQKMFQERLTDFYTQAIQRHNSSPTHSCTYSLHKIDQAALSDVELIIGARRGVPLPKSAFQFKLLNTTVIIDPDDDNYFSSQDASVRVVVDVQCQETFAVTDKITGNLLQGSLLMKTVIHQIALENAIDVKAGELRGDWEIIDIDNWLNGNRFLPEKAAEEDIV